jgi:hypothetical protein
MHAQRHTRIHTHAQTQTFHAASTNLLIGDDVIQVDGDDEEPDPQNDEDLEELAQGEHTREVVEDLLGIVGGPLGGVLDVAAVGVVTLGALSPCDAWGAGKKHHRARPMCNRVLVACT